VPTPFYHLDVAEIVLSQEDLPVEIQGFLNDHKPAFIFGNMAPDVQVVSGQNREETHFFRLPVSKNEHYPWDQIFHENPELTHPSRPSQDQAAFLAGYLCHLQADWSWAVEIFEPVFGMHATWGTFHDRLYLHNVLRSYMDLEVLRRLSGQTRELLEQSIPDGWLPFTQDHSLLAWRDLLTDQLKPGAEIQTIEVFAARQGISPAKYYKLLNSDQALESKIFSHLHRHQLESYLKNLIDDNIETLKTYLGQFSFV
jgi:hypothetical protein